MSRNLPRAGPESSKPRVDEGVSEPEPLSEAEGMSECCTDSDAEEGTPAFKYYAKEDLPDSGLLPPPQAEKGASPMKSSWRRPKLITALVDLEECAREEQRAPAVPAGGPPLTARSAAIVERGAELEQALQKALLGSWLGGWLRVTREAKRGLEGMCFLQPQSESTSRTGSTGVRGSGLLWGQLQDAQSEKQDLARRLELVSKESLKLRDMQEAEVSERLRLEKLLALDTRRFLKARVFLEWQRQTSTQTHEKEIEEMRAEVARMRIKMKNAAKFLTRFTAA